MGSAIDVKEKNYNLTVDYFHLLEETFEKSCNHLLGKQTYSFLLANYPVKINTAGKKLQPILCKAFSHLTQTNSSSTDQFEISVWDERETEIALPTPPWKWPSTQNPQSVTQFELKNYFVILADNRMVFYIYDITRNKAIICIKDVTLLPNYFLSSPFFKLIKLWSKRADLNIFHAGCVANYEHAVLFVGQGGKGKSTSAIQCLSGGLNYLGDDYVLVNLKNTPIAYSIYCSGKLHAHHLKNFPALTEITNPGIVDIDNKPIIYLNDLFKDQMTVSSPIKAIVVPNITSANNSFITRISPFEALKALAPSTIIQLDLGSNNVLSKMADLTKKTACYRLDLGTNLEGIAPEIKSLLSTL